MSEGFTYENSPAAPAASPAAPAGPDKASAAPGITPELQLTYDKTDRSAPKGRPADQLPPSILEQRQNDDARKLYSPQVTYKDAIKVAEGATEQEKAAAAETREILADLGLSVDAAKELVAVYHQGITEPPTDETVKAWEVDAVVALLREFGEAGTQQVIANVQKLCARDPLLVRFLEETRLGSNPRFIAQFVHAARSNRSRY